MFEKKFLDIRVNCLRELYRVEKMQMVFVKQAQGWFPLPCNGCESLDGDKACETCCAALTLMFFHNPDMDARDVLTPKLPDQKK